MKLYKKGSQTEDAPVLLQLQRRHTLAEVDQNIHDTTAHKTTSRSSSISDSTLNSSQATTEFQEQKSVNSTLSPDGNKTSLSIPSTVVISELSSSWLYKKAQMNTASLCESTCDSSAPSFTNQDKQPVQEISPTIPRPITHNKSNQRSKNVKICCCYTTAVCIVCLAFIGIMAAIVSIIYLEVFSYRNTVDNQSNTESNLTSTQSNIESNLTGKRYIAIHGLIPMQKIGDLLINENETIRNVVYTPDLKLSIDIAESSNSKHIHQENDSSSYVELNFVNKESDGIRSIMNEEIKTAVDKDAVFIANTNSLENESFSEADRIKDHAEGLFEKLEFTLPNLTDNFSIKNQKGESPYSKLFQLYNDLQNTKLRNLTALKEASDSLTDNVSNSKSLEISSNNSDINQQTIIKDKFRSHITGNDFDSILEQKFGTEQNKTGDLESHLTKSLPHHDQVVKTGKVDLDMEEDKILKNSSDMKQDKIENFESNLTKYLSHNDQILEKENTISVSKINLEHEGGKLEDFEQFLVKSSSHNQIPEKEAESLALKNISEVKQDKIDEVEPLLDKFLPRQEENLKFLEKLENLQNEHKNNNTQEQDLKNKTEVSLKPFGINQPIVGTNVAVPGPVELFRRLMLERETGVKPQVHQDDQDRKFSLAQALETLRKLDVNNQLPSARQKPMFAKSSEIQNRKIQFKIQGQGQDSERSHYLENLRRKFYEN